MRLRHPTSSPSDTDASSRRQVPRRGAVVPAALLVLLVVAVLASLCLGARWIGVPDIAAALMGRDAGSAGVVIRELRVPRTVIGLLVGSALGIAGVVMQGVTRNPVADPGLLGVNAGAAFAVVLGLSLGSVTAPLGMGALAILGALGTAALVAAVAASSRSGASPVTLVVAGAAVTAGMTSLTTLVLLSDPATMDRFRFWTVGSLSGRSLGTAATLAPLLVVGAVIAVVIARALDAMALGDDVASALGFRLRPTRAAALAAIVLLCGAATAMAGPLVFVGLLAAHGARLVAGSSHRRAIPVAAIGGAVTVLLADTVGRVIAPPGEVEVGIVVAMLGAPVLIALVRSSRARVL